MNALAFCVAHRLDVLGKCKIPVHSLRFLWAELDKRTNNATHGIVAVVNDKR